MATFSVYEAETQLATILQRVEQGEEVRLVRDGVIVARLVPEQTRRGIQLGRDEGKGSIASNFDAPIDGLADYTL